MRWIFLLLGASFAAAAASGAEDTAVAQWLWHRPAAVSSESVDTVLFRKDFELPGEKLESAELKVAADDSAIIYINGEKLSDEVSVRNRTEEGPRYRAETHEITRMLRPGSVNVIAAEARNVGGPGGFLLELRVRTEEGEKLRIVSDDSWRAAKGIVEEWTTPALNDVDWSGATVVGEEGDSPWFEVLSAPSVAPGESISLPEGFRAEVVRIAKKDEDTWVSMTIDDAGRLIVSAQHFPSEEWGGLMRFTLDADGKIAKEERISLPVGAAQGLLYAHESLYVQGEGPEGPGIYRLRDRDGDDRFDEMKFLRRTFNRGGSHGPHGLALGPDGMIYHISGDYSKPVDGIEEESPHRNFQEDLLLPRRWDASGHGKGVMAPCGHVQRFTPDGKRWELFCGGLRNPYGLAFNESGELFTYDADMEYDTGMPWYRATRVYHLVPGGEYGHREGTGKWPYYYPDSLPPVAEVGLGSPCGIAFGYRSHFPEKYRVALYLCDWAYGKIFAVHLDEEGSSYSGKVEEFAAGRPLNAMDIEFGPEGSMYLLTGGNDSQTALYRIWYEAASPPFKVQGSRFRVAESGPMAMRRRVEERELDGSEELWDLLGSEDRSLRYAARIALERGDAEAWRERALAEGDRAALITGMLALARMGKASDLPGILGALDRLEWGSLSREQKLELLRVYGVAFARLGQPGASERDALAGRLDAVYPAGGDFDLNRELSRLLVYLEAPSVIGKSLALVESAARQEEEIHFITVLRNVKRGWTLPERKAYFGWYERAAGEFTGGVSFYKFLANFKKDAIAAQADELSDAEKEELAPYLEDFAVAPPMMPTKAMEFVKAWTMGELEPRLGNLGEGRNFGKGKAAFQNAMCAACHRMFNEGGLVGPDLSAVASRFSRRDILEAIVDPNRTVMAQYESTMVTKNDGTVVVGRLIEESDEALTLVTDAIAQTRVVIPAAEVGKKERSPVSPMPSGLLNVLSEEEVLDLMAYLESGGSGGAAVYTKK